MNGRAAADWLVRASGAAKTPGQKAENPGKPGFVTAKADQTL